VLTKKRWFVWLSFLLLGIGLILAGCSGGTQENAASQEQLRALKAELTALRQSSAEVEEALAAHDGRLLTLEELESETMPEGASDVPDARLGELEEQITDLSSQLAELRSDFDELASTFAEMQQRMPQQPRSAPGSGNWP